MKARVSPVARVNDEKAIFPCLAVKIARRAIALPVERNGLQFDLQSVIGFCARYQENGKHTESSR
jgi:hypothetical protein